MCTQYVQCTCTCTCRLICIIHLALLNGDLVAVPEWVHGDTPLPLLVTLLEALLHDPVGPVHGQGLFLGRVAEVSTVDQTLQQLLAGEGEPYVHVHVTHSLYMYMYTCMYI